jgi:hypothetical protein
MIEVAKLVPTGAASLGRHPAAVVMLKGDGVDSLRRNRMRMALWVVFFVVSNLVGVEAFKAAVTLPADEALLPGILTVPLIGLTALSATRVVHAWKNRDE